MMACGLDQALEHRRQRLRFVHGVDAADEIGQRHGGRAARGIELVPAGSHFTAAVVELARQRGYAVAQRLLDFLDLCTTDPADVFHLGFGPDASRRFRLSRALRRFDLLVSGLTNTRQLLLRLLTRRLGRLADRRVALGRLLLHHFRLASLGRGRQLAAEGGHKTLDRRVELVILCHRASSDYTAHPDKSLTLRALLWPAERPVFSSRSACVSHSFWCRAPFQGCRWSC